MLGTDTGFTPRRNLASIRNILAQLSWVFVIYHLDIIDTKRTKLAPRYIPSPTLPSAPRFVRIPSNHFFLKLHPSKIYLPLTLIGERGIFCHRLWLTSANLLSPLPGKRRYCLPIQKEHPVGDYLSSRVPLPILAFPSTGMQPALSINPLTLVQVLVAILSQPTPSDHGKPFRLLLALTLRGGIHPVGGNTKAGYRIAIRGEAHLRLSSHIPYNHHLV
jgi:hypothetical protein